MSETRDLAYIVIKRSCLKTRRENLNKNQFGHKKYLEVSAMCFALHAAI